MYIFPQFGSYRDSTPAIVQFRSLGITTSNVCPSLCVYPVTSCLKPRDSNKERDLLSKWKPKSPVHTI